MEDRSVSYIYLLCVPNQVWLIDLSIVCPLMEDRSGS